jgi:GT2 family glycosyltransferase
MSVQTSCVQAFPTIVNQVLDTEILRRHFPRSRLWGNGVLLEPQGGIHEVDAISGACMMLDRHAFEEVGGFDERYFMYSEDVDLCLRIARMGWHNYCVSTAMVTHHGGRSSTKQGNLSFSAILMRQSRFKLFASSKGLFYATVYRLTMALNSVCRIVILRCALCVSHEPNRCFEFRASGQKWMAVLRWALGFEAWAKPSKEEVPQ